MTDIAKLRALPRETATQRLPMRLRGVVTYYEREKFMAFIQDATGGTYVSSDWNVIEPPGFAGPIRPGLLVEVEGFTNAGRFAPFLSVPKMDAPLQVRIVGEAPPPRPLRPVRGELLDPKFHSQWVEIEAFASEVRVEGKRLCITLVLGSRRFAAYLPGEWTDDDLPMLPGSDVRVRGVFGSIFNAQRELIGVQIFVPSFEHIEVLDAGLEQAFAQPPRALREIMQFNPGGAERMRVQGVVTLGEPGRGFYLRDASGAVWVENDQPKGLAPGTSVEAVGFATIEGATPVLRDAVVRVGPLESAPEPVRVDAERALDVALHGQLVCLEGLVVDRLILPQNHTLALQAGDTFFNARFARAEDGVELPERGSWVGMTGICQNIFRGDSARDPRGEAARQPVAFNVLMRGKSDLAVLRTPPWWTPERLMLLAGALAAIVLGSLVWVAMLGRRVREQSALIAEKLSHERIAEERTRIARELHDTLEQHLAGVAIQLEAAAAQLPAAPANANAALTLGAAMLRHSRTEARRSVWDLRSQLLERHGLPQTLRDLAASMSTEACRIASEVEGTDRRLDPQTEFHLLRIAQEAIANALKHSRATAITLTLNFAADAARLTVADNGVGFDPAANGAGGGSGAHFGLLGMRERTAKLRGTLQVESAPGHGTRVCISVPHHA